MKVTVKAHVLHTTGYDGKDQFALAMFPLESCGYVTVDVRDIEIEIPDDFDPRAKQIEILRKEKERIGAEFANRCTQIEEQISKLQCLEFSGDVVDAEVAA